MIRKFLNRKRHEKPHSTERRVARRKKWLARGRLRAESRRDARRRHAAMQDGSAPQTLSDMIQSQLDPEVPKEVKSAKNR